MPYREAGIGAIKMALADANLTIPYPQMDVHFDPEMVATIGMPAK